MRGIIGDISVVGGHFSLVALERACGGNAVTALGVSEWGGAWDMV
jgi:hypothetical protein